MRPTIETGGAGEYECFDCGNRQVSTDGRPCGRCGGETRNLNVSRDL